MNKNDGSCCHLFRRIIFTTAVLFLVSFWVFLTISLGKSNLSNPNLWFDEAGQFWIAKGLNHYSPPLSQNAGVSDVIKENSEYNLDPGGFSVLLHFWSVISNSVIWLRLLPYVFSVLSSMCIALIVFIWTRSVILALIFLNFINVFKVGLIWQYGFEVRAYSMEYFGVLILLLFLESYKKYKKNIYIVLLSVFMGIFALSRYSFFVYSLTMVIIVGRYFRKGYSKIFMFTIPFLIASFLTYFLALKKQLSVLQGYGAIHDLTIHGKSLEFIKNIFNQNLFNSINISLPSLFVLGLTIYLSNCKDSLVKKFHDVWLYVFISQAIFVVLSIFDLYPWLMSSRWSLSSQMVVLISFSVIASSVYIKFKNKFENYLSLILRRFYAAILITTLCLSGAIIISGNLLETVINRVVKASKSLRYINESTYENLLASNINHKDVKVFVAYKSAATIRYLYEYGPFNSEKYYPENFYFESGKEFYENEKIGDSCFFDYIIFPNLDDKQLAGYKKRFVFNVEDVTTHPPSRLYKRD